MSKPIIFSWNTNPITGERESIEISNEQHKVVNGQFPLTQIPDMFYKVQFVGRTMYEIKESQQIINPQQYKVDYEYGNVIVHPDLEDQTVNVRYFGQGVYHYPATRVYAETDNNGNVKKTIQDLINEGVVQVNDRYEAILQMLNSGQELPLSFDGGEFTDNTYSMYLLDGGDF